MALAADDDVIVHRYPEVPASLHDPLRNLDVGAARLGVSARVVVDEDQRGGADVEAASDHFARMDGGFVDRPVTDVIVQD